MQNLDEHQESVGSTNPKSIPELGGISENSVENILVDGHAIVGNYSFAPGIRGASILRDIEKLLREHKEKLSDEAVSTAVLKNDGKAPLKLVDDILVAISEKMSESPEKYIDFEAVKKYTNAAIYGNDINCSDIANVEIRRNAFNFRKNIEQNMYLMVSKCCRRGEESFIDKPETEVYESGLLPFGEDSASNNPNKKSGCVRVAKKNKDDKNVFEKIRMRVFFDPPEKQKEAFARSIGETVYRIACEREGWDFEEDEFLSWYEEFWSAIVDGNVLQDGSDCFGKVISTVAHVLNAKCHGVAEVLFCERVASVLREEFKANSKEQERLLMAGKFFRGISLFERARITGVFSGSPEDDDSMPRRVFDTLVEVLPSSMKSGEDIRNKFIDAWNRWFDGSGHTSEMHGFTLKAPVPESSFNVWKTDGSAGVGNVSTNTLSVKMNGKIQSIDNYDKMTKKAINKALENKYYERLVFVGEKSGQLSEHMLDKPHMEKKEKKGFNKAFHAIPSFDFHLLKTCAKISSLMALLKDGTQEQRYAGEIQINASQMLASVLARYFQYFFIKELCMAEKPASITAENIVNEFQAVLLTFVEETSTEGVKQESKTCENEFSCLWNFLRMLGRDAIGNFRLTEDNKDNKNSSIVWFVHEFSRKNFLSDLIAEKLSFNDTPVDIDFVVDIQKLCTENGGFKPIIDVDNAVECRPFLTTEFNSSGDEQTEEKKKPGLISKFVRVKFAKKSEKQNEENGTETLSSFGICTIPAIIRLSVEHYSDESSFSMASESFPPEKNIFLVVGHDETSRDVFADCDGKIPFMAGLDGTKISYVSDFCKALRVKIGCDEVNGESGETILFAMIYSYLSSTFFKILSDVTRCVEGEKPTLSVGIVRVHENDEKSPLSKISIAVCETIASYIAGLEGCIPLSQGIKASNISGGKSEFVKKSCRFSFVSGFPKKVIFLKKSSDIGVLSRKTAIMNINTLTTDRMVGTNGKNFDVCGVVDYCSTFILTPCPDGNILVGEKKLDPRYRVRRMDDERYAFDLGLFETVMKQCKKEGVKRIFLFARIPGSGVVGAYASSDEDYGMPVGNLFSMSPRHVKKMMAVAANYGMELVPMFSNDSDVLADSRSKIRGSFICFCANDTGVSGIRYGETAFGTFPFFFVNTVQPFPDSVNKSYFSHGTIYSGVADKKGLYKGDLLLRDSETKRDIATALTALHFTGNEKSRGGDAPLKQNVLETVANMKNKKALISRGAVSMRPDGFDSSDFSSPVVVFLPAFVVGMERAVKPESEPGIPVFVSKQAEDGIVKALEKNENTESESI